MNGCVNCGVHESVNCDVHSDVYGGVSGGVNGGVHGGGVLQRLASGWGRCTDMRQELRRVEHRFSNNDETKISAATATAALFATCYGVRHAIFQ